MNSRVQHWSIENIDFIRKIGFMVTVSFCHPFHFSIPVFCFFFCPMNTSFSLKMYLKIGINNNFIIGCGNILWSTFGCILNFLNTHNCLGLRLGRWWNTKLSFNAQLTLMDPKDLITYQQLLLATLCNTNAEIGASFQTNRKNNRWTHRCLSWNNF